MARRPPRPKSASRSVSQSQASEQAAAQAHSGSRPPGLRCTSRQPSPIRLSSANRAKAGWASQASGAHRAGSKYKARVSSCRSPVRFRTVTFRSSPEALPGTRVSTRNCHPSRAENWEKRLPP